MVTIVISLHLSTVKGLSDNMFRYVLINYFIHDFICFNQLGKGSKIKVYTLPLLGHVLKKEISRSFLQKKKFEPSP